MINEHVLPRDYINWNKTNALNTEQFTYLNLSLNYIEKKRLAISVVSANIAFNSLSDNGPPL